MLLRFVTGAAREPGHFRLSGLVAERTGFMPVEGLAADLGQCLLASQPHRQKVAQIPQPACQARRVAVACMVCPLPSKSSWLNPIAPRWVHGKRAILEPTRLLTAQELIARVCTYLVRGHNSQQVRR